MTTLRPALLRGRPQPSWPATLAALVGLAAFLASLLIWGCDSGTVTTSTGAVVPAATVQAQDAVADVLHQIREAHRSYVTTTWEAEKASLDPATRAKRYKLLNDLADGLDASQALLISWKQSSVGATPSTVLRPILASAPAFLDLAVTAGLLTAEEAKIAKGILASIPPDPNRGFASVTLPVRGAA